PRRPRGRRLHGPARAADRRTRDEPAHDHRTAADRAAPARGRSRPARGGGKRLRGGAAVHARRARRCGGGERGARRLRAPGAGRLPGRRAGGVEPRRRPRGRPALRRGPDRRRGRAHPRRDRRAAGGSGQARGRAGRGRRLPTGRRAQVRVGVRRRFVPGRRRGPLARLRACAGVHIL
ncbi:MAG: Protein-L-isoaspartate O-methyltransferase, partial [uncultured Sphingomonadaceae bacterium]